MKNVLLNRLCERHAAGVDVGYGVFPGSWMGEGELDCVAGEDDLGEDDCGEDGEVGSRVFKVWKELVWFIR